MIRGVFNIYDCIIIVIIVSLIYGGLDLWGNIRPHILIGGFGLIHFFFKKKMLCGYRMWQHFLCYLGLYMFITFICAPDTKNFIYGFVGIISAIGCAFEIMIASIKAKNPVRSIIIAWALYACMTLPIAFWEISTGDHLESGSFEENMTYLGHIRLGAAVTYGNSNSYSVMLCFALPYILSSYFDNGFSAKFKSLFLLIIIFMCVPLFINSSRGSLICLAVALMCFYLIIFSNDKSLFKLITLTFALYLGYYYLTDYLGFDLLMQITERIDNEGTQSGRLPIYLDGLKVAWNSTHFIGGGPGCLVAFFQRYGSGLIKVPHNLFLEMLIQFGLLTLIYFVRAFYKSTIQLWRMNSPVGKFLGLYIALSSIPLFMIDDEYLKEPGVWIYIASFVVIIRNLNYGRK